MAWNQHDSECKVPTTLDMENANEKLDNRYFKSVC